MSDREALTILIGGFAFFALLMGGGFWLGRGDKTYFSRHPLSGFWDSYPFNQLDRDDFQLIKVHDLINNLYFTIQFTDENEQAIAVLTGGTAQINSKLQIAAKEYKFASPIKKTLTMRPRFMAQRRISPSGELSSP